MFIIFISLPGSPLFSNPDNFDKPINFIDFVGSTAENKGLLAFSFNNFAGSMVIDFGHFATPQIASFWSLSCISQPLLAPQEATN